MTENTTLPAGCTEFFPWEDHDGQPVRYFRGTSEAIIDGSLDVHVEGKQTTQGVERAIVVNEVEVSADQLRSFVVACNDVLVEVGSAGFDDASARRNNAWLASADERGYPSAVVHNWIEASRH